MASFAAKKYVTLAPTVRTLASGVPTASVNLGARALGGHAHGAGRSDAPAPCTGGLSLSSSGLAKRAVVTRKPLLVFESIVREN